MILTSTLLCDRKASSQLIAVRNLIALTHPDVEIYLNIETDNIANFDPVFDLLKASGKKFHYDIWKSESSWAAKPAFDQDQARLHPICIGRNMSIQAAMTLGATHIFQVDADVMVPPDSVERLLKIGRPLAGGVVPGRGAHGHVQYVSHIKGNWNGYTECEYATCGFVLIARELFSLLKFRSGPHNRERHIMLSEDPAYGTDAHDLLGFPWWTLDMNLKAKHWDDPVKPLTNDQTAQF